MHAHREFWGSVVGLVALTVPLRAYACGEAAPSYFSFGAPTPAEASVGVARDAPVVVALNAYSIDDNPIYPHLSLESATLSDSAGNQVSLESSVWVRDDLSLVIAPRATLLPNERYQLSARIAEPSEPPPAGAIENDRLELSFTTGASLTPALALTGDLDVTLSTEQVPTLICDQPCGGPCRESGQHSALIAHVRLPALSGGSLERLGYAGVLYLTPGVPVAVGEAPFTGSVSGVRTSLQLTANASQTRDIELYAEVKENGPCFTLQAWDPGARHVVSLAKCIDLREVPAESDPSSEPAAASADDADSSPSSRACSVSVTGGGNTGAGPGLLFATLLGFLGVRRGRRSRRWLGRALGGSNDAVDATP